MFLAESFHVDSSGVAPIAPDLGEGDLLRLSLSVTRWWKGGDDETVELITVRWCGLWTDTDLPYFIVATRLSDGRLFANACSRSKLGDYNQPAAALAIPEALGRGSKPRRSFSSAYVSVAGGLAALIALTVFVLWRRRSGAV